MLGKKKKNNRSDHDVTSVNVALRERDTRDELTVNDAQLKIKTLDNYIKKVDAKLNHLNHRLDRLRGNDKEKNAVVRKGLDALNVKKKTAYSA